MSEPKTAARDLEEIVPGVYRYFVQDDRIDSESDAYALSEPTGTVLIDPLPLSQKSLGRLGRVEAVVLSAACHQRSAWRYRKQLGARVLAPAGAEGLEEKPDASYGPGDRLPGGLRALHAPGPTEAHYAFQLDRGTGMLFCGDLVTNLSGEGLAFVPGEYQDDPKRTRESVRSLLGQRFEVLCPSHGAPLTSAARPAIAELLRKDSGA